MHCSEPVAGTLTHLLLSMDIIPHHMPSQYGECVQWLCQMMLHAGDVGGAGYGVGDGSTGDSMGGGGVVDSQGDRVDVISVIDTGSEGAGVARDNNIGGGAEDSQGGNSDPST